MAEVGCERQPPLSQVLGIRGGLPHVDDDVLYRPSSADG